MEFIMAKESGRTLPVSARHASQDEALLKGRAVKE